MQSTVCHLHLPFCVQPFLSQCTDCVSVTDEPLWTLKHLGTAAFKKAYIKEKEMCTTWSFCYICLGPWLCSELIHRERDFFFYFFLLLWYWTNPFISLVFHFSSDVFLICPICLEHDCLSWLLIFLPYSKWLCTELLEDQEHTKMLPSKSEPSHQLL